MANITSEGFDWLGSPLYSNNLNINAFGWLQTGVQGFNTLVNGLSVNGQAMKFTVTGAGITAFIGFTKSWGAGNFTRSFGGVWISSDLNPCANGWFIGDSGVPQVTFCTNSTGSIQVRSGGCTGTVIGTTAAGLYTANSVFLLEWDVTINSTTGSVTLYLNGNTTTPILTLTNVNTRGGSTNNYVNGFGWQGASNNVTSTATTFDNAYINDNTGSAPNNGVLGDWSRVQTDWANSDSATAWSVGSAILGQNNGAYTSTSNAPGANTLVLLKVTPTANMTIASIVCVPQASSTTANFKPCIYTDSAGAPGTLLSGGSQVTGAVANTYLQMPLTTPQALTAGTSYWIGYATDTSLAIYQSNTTANQGVKATITFSTAPPSTAPAMTTGQVAWAIWGLCTASAQNNLAVKGSPSLGDQDYVYSTTVGAEDLYGFPNLPFPIATIHAVSVAAYMKLAYGGARTLSLRGKSGATDDKGSAGNFTITTGYLWYSTSWNTDPNTGTTWTSTAVNALTGGMKIEA
jgi:hypothetical protein